jgi:glutathione S-transferase
MNESITVYSFRRCPFAMRVRMTLHEKKLPFKVQEENLKAFSPQLLALHPEAKVPVLVHGARVLYESSIITEYLDDAFPEQPLMPMSAGLKAEVRLWTYWCNSLFKPDLDRFKYGKNRFPESECLRSDEKVTQHLEKLKTQLGDSRFLVGERFSLADIHVFPFVRQLTRISPSPEMLSQFPTVLNWVERVGSRPSFTLAMEN